MCTVYLSAPAKKNSLVAFDWLLRIAFIGYDCGCILTAGLSLGLLLSIFCLFFAFMSQQQSASTHQVLVSSLLLCVMHLGCVFM